MPDINYTALGKQIRFFRRQAGMTQAQLCEFSGVEASNISHIERGAAKVSLPTLIKLANVLHASVDELLWESTAKNEHITLSKINELTKDCTKKELEAVLMMVKTTLEILRQL